MAERLVLAARKVAYGEELVYCGPVYESHKVNGSQIEVSFKHIGGGLEQKAYKMENTPVSADKLLGFEISTDGKNYVAADATISGSKVIVSSSSVKSPKHVRYAWSGFPKANLFNKEGLPTSPFRTDKEIPKIK